MLNFKNIGVEVNILPFGATSTSSGGGGGGDKPPIVLSAFLPDGTTNASGIAYASDIPLTGL